MKIILLGVLPSSLTNFRGELIKEYVSTGFPVETYCSGATPEDIEKVNSLGASCNNYSVARNGLNPIKDLVTLFQLSMLTRKVGNKKILAYTIKPVIWGGVASRLSSTTSFYALVTGLGYAFQPGGKLKTALNNLVKNLYKIALKNANAVIFQNPDNMQVFIDQGIVPKEKCFLVNGSGVNLSHYEKEPLSNKPHFLLIARLLGDKGIREYAKAAAVVKQQYPEAEFHLVGPEDPSPDGIQISEVNLWHESGVIHYHGATSDVRPFIKACNIFVLPSYHEGMPRTVLEAMAMGRPVLTTNVPGCKETVVNGENGWLVEKANVEQLAERMIWFIEHPEQWKIMGDKGHQMANEKFDVHKVNAEILKIMGLADEKAI
ncbi:glycosyltransferase family 4 protein [Vibrio vulnificus]|uniref:glycosyltransferase family 4 protein n=1 Tax=Vibrio vulnificus TaxID=672 RepID=UPI0004F7C4F1|nr:glycosyltransferase family 4 protein [Vibrio vulnificus]AIL69432.1 glycosyl transferase family 1 [Vibrio vulnificus]EHU9448971.1 glycosyltransferase family 4 protein [Vibrio vulnificus]ELV8620540.1 glycosyltransferase family 4 protein [Vibrio vulnificus]ELV8644350.1 glycosyltransferase family 4 protein [Vibrio vulnificus]PWY29403.1 glycosyltransferase family 1 protein [Vibrio vulnificus]